MDEKKTKNAMSEARFEDLAAAYGANLERWPEAECTAAETLLETSLKARAALEHERLLDQALDGWEAPQPSEALMTRILGDAAELGAPSSAELPVAAPVTAEKPGLLTRLFGEWGWRPAGAMAACLAIGFAAGFSGAPAPLDEIAPQTASVESESEFDVAFFGEEDGDLFGLETL